MTRLPSITELINSAVDIHPLGISIDSYNDATDDKTIVFPLFDHANVEKIENVLATHKIKYSKASWCLNGLKIVFYSKEDAVFIKMLM